MPPPTTAKACYIGTATDNVVRAARANFSDLHHHHRQEPQRHTFSGMFSIAGWKLQKHNPTHNQTCATAKHISNKSGARAASDTQQTHCYRP
jgi:hypothetical protein